MWGQGERESLEQLVAKSGNLKLFSLYYVIKHIPHLYSQSCQGSNRWAFCIADLVHERMNEGQDAGTL